MEDAILIHLETARELVAPDTLEDVLETLLSAGTIRAYEMGTDSVEIIPSPNRRFDIAMVAIDLRTNAPKSPGQSKR